MHRHLAPVAATLLAALAIPRGAHAQSALDSVVGAVMPPACHETGVRRVAVMVPPGQTTEQLRATIARGMFPAGTEVAILQPRDRPALRDVTTFREVIGVAFRRLERDGVQIDGRLSTLLVLDADGRVREAHPNTRNNQINRVLADAWKQVAFVPYVLEGCRVPAWVHVQWGFYQQ